MNLFNLNPTEQLIAIFRKHPIFIWIAAIKYVVLAVLPMIALPLVNSSMNINLNGYGSIFYILFLILLFGSIHEV